MSPYFRLFLMCIGAWALIILGISVANAAPRTVTWTNPTTYTDGTAIAAGDITSTTVVYGASASALTQSKVIAGAATTTTLDLAPGTWYIAAKTTAKGVDSALSNTVSVTVAQPAPNPPVLSVVPVVAGLNMAPAYKILADGTRSSTVAGFVPVTTACNGPAAFTYRSKSYYRVPKDSVKWWATPATDAVAAPCA